MKPPQKQPERETHPHRAKKDTKRWCKGVVGREHKPVLVKRDLGSLFHVEEKVCEVCNKRLSWASSFWTWK